MPSNTDGQLPKFVGIRSLLCCFPEAAICVGGSIAA